MWSIFRGKKKGGLSESSLVMKCGVAWGGEEGGPTCSRSVNSLLARFFGPTLSSLNASEDDSKQQERRRRRRHLNSGDGDGQYCITSLHRLLRFGHLSGRQASTNYWQRVGRDAHEPTSKLSFGALALRSLADTTLSIELLVQKQVG